MKQWTEKGAALHWAAIGFGALAFCARAENAPVAVDFYKDIHPFLESNCIPCHNKTTTKGTLAERVANRAGAVVAEADAAAAAVADNKQTS